MERPSAHISRKGMNLFLSDADVTFRRDIESHRPRINKPSSRKDRERNHPVNTSTQTMMDHWLLEGPLGPIVVGEEPEDGGLEGSLPEEVDYKARVSELEEELQYAKAET